MGLIQKAIETYDCSETLVGEYREGSSPLAPIGHILTRPNLEITITRDGKLVTARRVDSSEEKILIPVTEESGGRSGTKAFERAHPLCEQISYLDADKNYFIPQMEQWADSEFSHPFLHAILTYLKNGKVKPELETLVGAVEDKDLVCWRVIGIEDEEPACWKNKKLFRAYEQYYLSLLEKRGSGLCMASGEEAPIALQHPKGIIAFNGNAKLISANDSSGFTYRGRFTDADSACSVSYVASQKAHSAIRWLVENQGVRENIGGRIFLCWNPQGKRLPKPMRRMRIKDEPPRYKPSDYRDALRSTLFSFRRDSQLKDLDNVIIASFDAATTGRLALTYYNEISADVFLNRLQSWEEQCCWFFGPYGIQAPNLLDIVNCAFGLQRGEWLETDDAILRQHIQRLLDCKVNGGVFPADIVTALVQRASMPLCYSDSVWRKIVSTACAAMQKYRYDTGKGGNEMAWDLNKKDRSFQYGRLLAIMERAEADYYGKTQETRQTNAIKFMAEFRRRPFYVFEYVNRTLHQAYLPRIDQWQAVRYEKLTGEVFAVLKEFEEAALNKPLEDIYLMGYELQRNAFFEKKETSEMEE